MAKVNKISSKKVASTSQVYKKDANSKPSSKGTSTVAQMEALEDYRVAVRSRQTSLLGRREVMSGKAKFGIFGDGKELAQLAMARAFAKGDFRSGYYRDQTFMFALGISDVRKFYAQLYAHTDIDAEPSSGGRSMNGHFASRFLNADGSWRNVTDEYNSSADVSPTASQMPRLVGLAYASKIFAGVDGLREYSEFSRDGKEVAWGTIGNASAAEGMFWESINAIGVLGAPAVVSIWDDGYGISVPNEYQNTKGDLGALLRGFCREDGKQGGYDLHVVKGWDYPALRAAYQKAGETARLQHVPQIIHVVEVTQPQGHSTSGSHERYKSKERLQWEIDFDCIARFKEWIVAQGYSTVESLDEIEAQETELVRVEKQAAWDAYMTPVREELSVVAGLISALALDSADTSAHLQSIAQELLSLREPFYRDLVSAASRSLIAARNSKSPSRKLLQQWKSEKYSQIKERYSSHLHSESAERALNISYVAPTYADDASKINGSELINLCFDSILSRDPRVVIFGEDVGKLGDVNQGCIGLQAKYGELRVSDTGIRECTILGQAIGMAMRGLRPIAEIQYLDYLLYALQLMSDDLATVQWRTRGGQKAPVIIRTRGHRLEGVWHSGSPMSGIINLVRGIHVCVPRNFTQAAGMYNTLLASDEPGLIVEVLNAYRLKEQVPANIAEMKTPLGVPEIIREGSDVTIVTYGASCRPTMEAADMLKSLDCSAEVIDVQTLLPFDIHGKIVESLKKTNRIIFIDEDVPGGVTAMMMQNVLEIQGGYKWLDSTPKTLTAAEHRAAYGTDGNYWSKPEADHIFEAVYSMMIEANPQKYPPIF